jgi:hypothetical protein
LFKERSIQDPSREFIMKRCSSIAIIGVAALGVCASCSRTGAASGGTRGDVWQNNGAHACEKYLTRDVVASILSVPEGTSKTLSVQACAFSTGDSGGSITITLSNAGPAAFDAYQKYHVDPQPLAGVGDRASQSILGIDAVKGADRSCSIDAGGAPGSLRVKGAELAQKLGALCNQLFALP